MKGYVVIYERVEDAWHARSPDLPDCRAEGETLQEAESRFRLVLEAHLERLKAEGQEPPEPAADLRLFDPPD